MGFELLYGFARDHGVLVAALGAEHAEVLVREDARPQALAEVRRSVGVVEKEDIYDLLGLPMQE